MLPSFQSLSITEPLRQMAGALGPAAAVTDIAPRQLRGAVPSRRYQLVDLLETTDHFVAVVDAPGVTKEGLKLSVSGRQLNINTFRSTAASPEESYRRRERRSGNFERTITLPENCDSNRITSTVEHGGKRGTSL